MHHKLWAKGNRQTMFMSLWSGLRKINTSTFVMCQRKKIPPPLLALCTHARPSKAWSSGERMDAFPDWQRKVLSTHLLANMTRIFHTASHKSH